MLWNEAVAGVTWDTPGEVEIYLTHQEIADRCGYALGTVKVALWHLEDEHGAIVRTWSIRNHRQRCILLVEPWDMPGADVDTGRVAMREPPPPDMPDPPRSPETCGPMV